MRYCKTAFVGLTLLFAIGTLLITRGQSDDKDVLSVGIRSPSLTDTGLSLVWCVQNLGNHDVYFDANSIAQVSVNSNEFFFPSNSVILQSGDQYKIDISVPLSYMRIPGLNTVKITAKSGNGTTASVIESFEF